MHAVMWFLEDDVPLDNVLHEKIGKLIKSPSMFHILSTIN